MNKKIFSLQKILLLLCISTSLWSTAEAQVTIGSNQEPNPLSLLDLKENNQIVNSRGGLGLPRVKLTDKNNLYPMFETSEGSGIANSSYSTEKQREDAMHTGLIVYNLNKCDGFGPGIYVWGGQEWEPLAKVNVISRPNISITNPLDVKKINDNTFLVDLPSGKDLRTFPLDKTFALGLDWLDPANGNLTISNIATFPTFSNDLPGPDGGLKFTSNPASGWTSPSVTSTPVTFTYGLSDMSDIIPSENANTSNPFRSRETSVTFQAPANDCYPARQVTVRLNQTNYRLAISKDNWAFNTFGYRFREEGTKNITDSKVHYYRFLIIVGDEEWNPFEFETQSNARWSSHYKETTRGIIGTINVAEQGGQEIVDGATPPLIYHWPTYIAGDNAKNKYKEAGYIIFKDTAAIQRYYPVEMHIMQCRACDYEDTNIQDGGSGGDGVLRHEDQDNNPFLSAVFGTAGRWMITNLAATKYDTQSGMSGSLTPFVETTLNDHSTAMYAYPVTNKQDSNPDENINWGDTPSDWRREEGIFYNWYAATGRSYDADYTENEGNLEGLTTVQGICPNGWHIPSDKEWSELEKVIYENIDGYGTYDEVDLSTWNMRQWDSNWDNQTGFRGDPVGDGHIGHGGAMKGMCPPQGSAFSYLTASKGYSKEPNSGGFNAILVGLIVGDDKGTPLSVLTQKHRAWNTEFWSSSQSTNDRAWFRGLQLEQGGVDRQALDKTRLVSVRCKKNVEIINTSY
ncbi:FISUMP domain-containing protein [Dysgonomonas sp.]